MLEAKSINFRYEIEKEVYLSINNLSLSLQRGQIISLLGQSGSGKSTVASILAGLRNDVIKGTVTCDGQVINQPEPRVALVLQSYKDTVFHWLTVQQNIELGFYKSNLKPDIKKIDELAEYLNIKSFLKKYPNELSGGQLQKVQIARALISDCDFLILDEPSSSLDMKFRVFLLELIINLKEKHNKGILLVSHNIDEAVYISEYINIIKKDESKNISVSKHVGYNHKTPNLKTAQQDNSYQEIFSRIYNEIFPEEKKAG